MRKTTNKCLKIHANNSFHSINFSISCGYIKKTWFRHP